MLFVENKREITQHIMKKIGHRTGHVMTDDKAELEEGLLQGLS